MNFYDALKNIKKYDEDAVRESERRWLNVAKPLFSLGKLEKIISQIAGIKRTPAFRIDKKAVVIMCADNGVVEEGVSQSTYEVTSAVVRNFLKGKASVCIIAQASNTDIFPIDVGMKENIEGVESRKTANGTKNIAKEAAMTKEQAVYAIEAGINKVIELKNKGYDIIAAGEMGIGNTTTSTAVMCTLLGLEPEYAAGRGAGLSSEGLKKKIRAVKRAIEINNPDKNDIIDVISKTGGFDIAGITGLFIGGALCGIPIITDGIITGAAACCAVRLNGCVRDYIIGSHISKEPLGRIISEELNIDTLIDAGMFLGEGSGAAAVIPLIEMANNIYLKMPTFQNGGINQVYQVFD